MPASWKKIVLEGLEANLNQITASSGIQIAPSLTLNAATNTDFKVLVADSTTGDVKGEDQVTVGNGGSSTLSFVTMSIGGTATVSSSQADDTLTLLTGSEGPLSIVGGSTQLRFLVATHSREDVEDLADDLLTGPHQDITVNYTDSGTSPGTFSLTGSSPITFLDTPGYYGTGTALQQEGVDWTTITLPISTSNAKSSLRNDSNVRFANITVNPADFFYNDEGNPENNPLGPNAPNLIRYYGGGGNISQTSNLQVHGIFGGFESTGEPVEENTVAGYNVYSFPNNHPSAVYTNSGDYISASALHIVNNAGINNDLTMSGDFIFQGFKFGDSHVLTHDSGNLFGSGSMPTALANSHQFTGSIVVTGSSITLQQSNSFIGNGGGITGIVASAIEGTNGNDLLYTQSFGDSIGSEISGAFSFILPTLRTASTTDGTISAVTASGTTVTANYTGLASGKQIWTLQKHTTGSFKTFVADNFVVSSSTDDATEGLDIITANTIGGTPGQEVTQKIRLNISKSGTDASTDLVGGDSIMFATSSGANPTLKTTITNLSGSIVGSVLGTVTEISAGNGISVTHGTGYDGTTVVDTTIDILLSGSEGDPTNNSDTYSSNGLNVYTRSNLSSSANNLALNPYIKLHSVTADTASIGYLKVTDTSFLGQTEELTIQDNFILLNANIDEFTAQGNNEDAGFSINRGDQPDANLFWDEQYNRWSINLANLQSGSSEDTAQGFSTVTAIPDSYLAVTSFAADSSHPDVVNPLMPGGTGDGVGNIHVNTTVGSPEVWIYA